MTDLSRLPRAELAAMAEAGRDIVEIERVLAKTGDTVVAEALRHGGVFYEWRHYPPGEDVIGMLDRFAVDLARPSLPLNRWITAIFRLFRPEMAELLRERDAAVMNWRRRRRGKVHVFEDRRLEVTSAAAISVADQLRR